jgi:hypothetical protein
VVVRPMLARARREQTGGLWPPVAKAADRVMESAWGAAVSVLADVPIRFRSELGSVYGSTSGVAIDRGGRGSVWLTSKGRGRK